MIKVSKILILMQRAVNIFFSQHLCHHHHPDQIATFLLTTTTGFGRPLFHNKNLVLAAEVFKILEIVFSPSVALVFFVLPVQRGKPISYFFNTSAVSVTFFSRIALSVSPLRARERFLAILMFLLILKKTFLDTLQKGVYQAR